LTELGRGPAIAELAARYAAAGPARVSAAACDPGELGRARLLDDPARTFGRVRSGALGVGSIFCYAPHSKMGRGARERGAHILLGGAGRGAHGVLGGAGACLARGRRRMSCSGARAHVLLGGAVADSDHAASSRIARPGGRLGIDSAQAARESRVQAPLAAGPAEPPHGAAAACRHGASSSGPWAAKSSAADAAGYSLATGPRARPSESCIMSWASRAVARAAAWRPRQPAVAAHAISLAGAIAAIAARAKLCAGAGPGTRRLAGALTLDGDRRSAARAVGPPAPHSKQQSIIGQRSRPSRDIFCLHTNETRVQLGTGPR
jgi:hypothetical protein